MAKGITCANCCYLDRTEKIQTGVRKTEKNPSCRYIYLGTVGKHLKKRCLYNLTWKLKECVDDGKRKTYYCSIRRRWKGCTIM